MWKVIQIYTLKLQLTKIKITRIVFTSVQIRRHSDIVSNFTEDLMKETFHQYGNIQEVRIFADKGFAFVRFVHLLP